MHTKEKIFYILLQNFLSRNANQWYSLQGADRESITRVEIRMRRFVIDLMRKLALKFYCKLYQANLTKTRLDLKCKKRMLAAKS